MDRCGRNRGRNIPNPAPITSTTRPRTSRSFFIRSGFEMSKDFAATVDEAWERRDEFNASTKGVVRDAVDEALSMLDSGQARVAEKFRGEWIVHQWLKKAVLLSFRLND